MNIKRSVPFKTVLKALSQDSLVAFIDESYRVSKNDADSYYILTAYIIQHRSIDSVELAIGELVRSQTASGRWHTTEINQTPDGDKKMEAFAQWIASTTGVSIVQIKKHLLDADPRAEGAREECIIQLLDTLTSKKILGFIFEKRIPSMHKIDQATIHKWRKQNPQALRSIRICWCSPGEAPLLYVPDFISYVYRPYVQTRWSQTIQDKVKVLEI